MSKVSRGIFLDCISNIYKKVYNLFCGCDDYKFYIEYNDELYKNKEIGLQDLYYIESKMKKSVHVRDSQRFTFDEPINDCFLHSARAMFYTEYLQKYLQQI